MLLLRLWRQHLPLFEKPLFEKPSVFDLWHLRLWSMQNILSGSREVSGGREYVLVVWDGAIAR